VTTKDQSNGSRSTSHETDFTVKHSIYLKPETRAMIFIHAKLAIFP